MSVGRRVSCIIYYYLLGLAWYVEVSFIGQATTTQRAHKRVFIMGSDKEAKVYSDDEMLAGMDGWTCGWSRGHRSDLFYCLMACWPNQIKKK